MKERTKSAARQKPAASIVLPVLLIAVLLAVFALLYALFAPRSNQKYDVFDESTEGMIDVVTETAYTHSAVERAYYTLASGNRLKLSEPFTPDAMETYEVPDDCFETYMDDQVRSRLVRMALTNENGQAVEITPELAALFEETERTVEHEIINMNVLRVSEELFVYIELNVNLWTPCDLYYFSPETSKLIRVKRWDNEKVVGIRLRNPSLLHSLN